MTDDYIARMTAAFNAPKIREERIWGPPGTGKTTTLSRLILDAVKHYGSDNVLVASFTKAAAVELVGRNLPVDAEQVGTLHAICYRALGMPTIAETRMAEWNEAYPTLTMTASASGNDDPSWDASSRTDADRMMASYQTQRSRMIDPDAMKYESGAAFGQSDFEDFAARWEDWKSQNGYLDFGDMLAVAHRDFDTAPGDPSMMVLDESQDLAPLELALARKWAKHMDRFVVAGDDDQAIMSFRGADPQSIFGEKPHSETVLAQSYRVPRAVHALANAWIKKLSWRVEKEYRPRDADGFVEKMWNADYGDPGRAVRRAKELVAEGKTVMFLASCSYMLRSTCAALKDAGVPYHNPYKAKRGDWNPLAIGSAGRKTAVDRVVAYLAIRPDARALASDARVWDADEFRLWATQINGKDLFRHGAKKLIASKDFALPPDDAGRIAAIGNLLRPEAAELSDLEHFGNALEGNLDWLYARLAGEQGQRMRYPVKIAKEMGPRSLLEKPKVIVGTGHSVKGGECDVAFIIPDISYAGYEEWRHSGPRQDSVRRLFYVMATRAREGVYLLGNSTQQYCPMWAAL